MLKTKSLKYQSVSIGSMNEQINVRMPVMLLKRAKTYAKGHGFATVQELIKETMREKLFEEPVGGLHTSHASEKALAKRWLTKEEDKAWAHLQEKT